MCRASLLLVLLLAASPAFANPLLGAWKSDRQLTLERLAVDKVSPEKRRMIVEEADLGNAVVEFRADEYRWTLGKQKRRLPYRVVAVRGNHVDIEYLRHPSETSRARMTLFVSGDLLYTPVQGHGFYEVFRRIQEPAAAP